MSPVIRSRLPIDRFAVLDSTSDEARRRVVAGGVESPFVVRADRQTHGRGRGSNIWWSDSGSLMFTLALDPVAVGIERRNEPKLALVAGLAVIEASRRIVDAPIGIRWPNDVEVFEKKLAGVLPERVETDEGARILIGVGLNVSTRFADAPADVRAMATSLIELIEEHGSAGSLPAESAFDALLTGFLDSFAKNLTALVQDDPVLSERWNALDRLAGRIVRVQLGDRTVVGIGGGIDDDGGLILDTEDGRLTLYGGQVLRDGGRNEKRHGG